MARPVRVQNPPNPHASEHVEWDDGAAPAARLEVFEERAKGILSENRSPDIGFRFSLNPYRGCYHGCIYCYARPTHQYWSLGAGSDFDRRLIVKVNAPALLERRLSSPRWRGDSIAFSGNTDCYQPLEASYELTRRCLEVCLAHANPIGVISKGTLIRRDIGLLAELSRRAGCRVSVSLAFSDDAMRKVFDPYAPPVEARLETMRRLAEAGIEVGLAMSPLLPGVNDSMIPELLARAAEAGASHAFMTLVRLSGEVRPYFEAQLRARLPQRADKVLAGIREHRGGRMNDPRFGHRMRGESARWAATRQLFEIHRRRHGLSTTDGGMDLDFGPPPARRPERGQLRLPLLDG
jgi:DNA repair photolyase